MLTYRKNPFEKSSQLHRYSDFGIQFAFDSRTFFNSPLIRRKKKTSIDSNAKQSPLIPRKKTECEAPKIITDSDSDDDNDNVTGSDNAGLKSKGTIHILRKHF